MQFNDYYEQYLTRYLTEEITTSSGESLSANQDSKQYKHTDYPYLRAAADALKSGAKNLAKKSYNKAKDVARPYALGAKVLMEPVTNKLQPHIDKAKDIYDKTETARGILGDLGKATGRGIAAIGKAPIKGLRYANELRHAAKDVYKRMQRDDRFRAKAVRALGKSAGLLGKIAATGGSLASIGLTPAQIRWLFNNSTNPIDKLYYGDSTPSGYSSSYPQSSASRRRIRTDREDGVRKIKKKSSLLLYATIDIGNRENLSVQVQFADIDYRLNDTIREYIRNKKPEYAAAFLELVRDVFEKSDIEPLLDTVRIKDFVKKYNRTVKKIRREHKTNPHFTSESARRSRANTEIEPKTRASLPSLEDVFDAEAEVREQEQNAGKKADEKDGGENTDPDRKEIEAKFVPKNKNIKNKDDSESENTGDKQGEFDKEVEKNLKQFEGDSKDKNEDKDEDEDKNKDEDDKNTPKPPAPPVVV